MNRDGRRHSLAVLAALCIASPAVAQSGPRLSASLQLGWEHTVGREFFLSSGYAAEGAITARVAVIHGVGLMVTAADGGTTTAKAWAERMSSR
jgi:hypothetical protein